MIILAGASFAAASIERAMAGEMGNAVVWIGDPDAPAAPIVLHFRREEVLRARPKALWVRVSADNRFILQVNGVRVASGPTTGDLAHWRYARIDIAPYLTRGRNVIAATVWNFVKPDMPVAAGDARAQMIAEYRNLTRQTGPAAQISARTAFMLAAEDRAQHWVDSGPGWRVARDPGHSATPGMTQVKSGFYVAGAPEVIDAAKALRDPAAGNIDPAIWRRAVIVAAADQPAPWTLVPDLLPPMRFVAVASGHVVRSDLDGGDAFPARPVVVPPHRKVKLLIARDQMVAAYPQLHVSGGKGARIGVTYAEALVDGKGRKGIRSQIDGREARGLRDEFLADGSRHSFAPLWWRVWRFVEIEVETADAPLTLKTFKTFETGYPFGQVAHFRSSDPELDRIWQIGWRTAQIDAHDTFMDTAYWEQLQYIGDTRLQALISTTVSGDARLARQAIEAFGRSRVDGGLTEGAYPSRRSNIIPPFSLIWVGMLHDWWRTQPDVELVRHNLPRAREVLDWFRRYEAADGMLQRTPHWSFIDWPTLDGRKLTREEFPSYDATGVSCLTSLIYLGAIRQLADLERAVGDATAAPALDKKADALRSALRDRCRDSTRGLYADDPSHARFSQHANALAILYGVATPDEAPDILRKIKGSGIDAPPGIIETSYYFAWYLVRAHERAGLASEYLGLLETWRRLLPLDFTTWPEEREPSRSDTHAWSAHPTADLLALVAGIQPAGPGYASVVVAPALGHLTRLDAAAATPAGAVRVRYRVANGRLSARIEKPEGLPGQFVWKGQSYPLDRRVTRFNVAF